jgi:8-amino-7-oxononanoate synthase
VHSGFDSDLRERLQILQDQGLHRHLRPVDSPQGREIEINGRILLNFSSNDYLGLAAHPLLKEAAIRATEKWGTGSGASRLICGSLGPHDELESALAAFKRTEAALTFSSGYATAIGTICALLEKDDIIVIDKLVHACCVDAARQSGARLRVFGHNNLEDLEDVLRWSLEHHPNSRVLIVTESVFSMDGDVAPLREMVEMKERYGAWLMVDEAHATGVLGNGGRGLAEGLGVGEHIEIQMGTLGKALGAAGGYVCGSRTLVDFLINRARSFIFSTAPSPVVSAAAAAGIALCQSEEGDRLRNQLQQRISELPVGRTSLAGELEAGVGDVLNTENGNSPGRDARPTEAVAAIVPVIIGDETETMELAAKLREVGFFIPAIRYPTVARGKARLRITFTSGHTRDDVARLAVALKELAPALTWER